MATNEKQVLALRALATLREARSGAAAWGGRRPLPPAVSVPHIERWKDGTPRDPELAILARFDEERFRLDAEYQGRPEVQKDAAHLLQLREAKREGIPADRVVVSEADASQLRYDLQVEELNSAIAEFERRKAVLEPPPAPHEKTQ